MLTTQEIIKALKEQTFTKIEVNELEAAVSQLKANQILKETHEEITKAFVESGISTLKTIIEIGKYKKIFFSTFESKDEWAHVLTFAESESDYDKLEFFLLTSEFSERVYGMSDMPIFSGESLKMALLDTELSEYVNVLEDFQIAYEKVVSVSSIGYLKGLI